MNGIHCAFTGRLGSDPEQRYTKTGKPLLAIRVAVDETTVESEDRAAPETQWVRVITWEELALGPARLAPGHGSIIERPVPRMDAAIRRAEQA